MISSDDEAGPSVKHIKLDTTDAIMDVRSMNKLFPKIDNLEHFPEKVLIAIFAEVDDLDLYNLAEESARFEKIAKTVLNDRYTHLHFTVDESETKWKRIGDDHSPSFMKCVAFFQRFGKGIKAVEIKNVTCVNQNDSWISRLLDEATNLKELTFNKCRIEYKHLLQHAGTGITHLTLRVLYPTQVSTLPDYRHLKKLEVWIYADGIIPMDSMAEIFRNNPTLEGLVLAEEFGVDTIGMATHYPFGEVMRSIGAHLNQLKELTYVCNEQVDWDILPVPTRVSDDIVDAFVRSLRQLESLTLSSSIDQYTDFFELLRRLNSECANIKHLTLYDVDREDYEMFDVIWLFNRIESLSLRFTNFSQDADMYEHLISMVKHLSCLRQLTLTFGGNISVDWLYMPLSLISVSRSLEKLVLESDYEDSEMEIVGTSQFYAQFIGIMPKPNTELVVNVRKQLMGSVSKNEVIWRNKLMYWEGYNPDRSLSNINLLDLGKRSQDAANAERPNPLDLILGYLDLNSLYALATVNGKCLQLVENHAKQHSQQQGTFLITDELNRDADYHGLEMFSDYVINLRANVLYRLTDHLQILLWEFPNLKKLYIHTRASFSPHQVIVPHVRHLVYDGPGCNRYSQLYDLSCACPDLEKLKLKREMQGDIRMRGEHLKFRKLKKFQLKHGYNIHLEDLKALFEGTNTKLTLNI